MPDKNKLEALTEAGFQVKKTCLRCASFDQGGSFWGTCRKIRYQHLKHTAPHDEPKRGFKASVPVDGWCPQHETWLEAKALLGAHSEFMEKGGFPDPCPCGKKALDLLRGEALCFDCFEKALEKRGP